MTHLLVVHPDPMVVWDRTAALEYAGYSVETCAGPGSGECPVMNDEPCPLLDRADALIYDSAVGSPPEMQALTAHLRDMYADLPLIVLGPADAADDVRPDSPRVWRVPSAGTVAELAAIVEEALTEQGMAV